MKQLIDILLIKVAKVNESSAIDRFVLVARHPHLALIVRIVLALILLQRSPFFWMHICWRNTILASRRLNLSSGGGRKVDSGQK